MAEREPILVEREKTHGLFGHVAHTAQQLKAVFQLLEHRRSPAQNEALDLIATKLARILHGNPNEPDHWKDIAGYAKLGEEACK